jgi:DNA-binding NarL/FixJ family response regulator
MNGAGRLPSVDPVISRDALTTSERRIAELAAIGRQNGEIAAELSLSPRTVEWHLSRIYRKLGVRSRTELAARGITGAAQADRRVQRLLRKCKRFNLRPRRK